MSTGIPAREHRLVRMMSPLLHRPIGADSPGILRNWGEEKFPDEDGAGWKGRKIHWRGYVAVALTADEWLMWVWLTIQTKVKKATKGMRGLSEERNAFYEI